MPDTIIECALTGKLDAVLLMKWLNEESVEDTPEDCILNCCNRNEFVAYFLSYLRNQTDSILQTNSNVIQILHNTPEKILSRRKHRRSISDPTSDDRSKDSLSVKPDRHSSHESPSKDRKRGRKVKTKLFPEDRNQSVSSDESRLSIGVDRLIVSSTPMKNGIKGTDYPNLASPVTPTRTYNERCDTPRLSHRHSRSSEKSCLGDYLVNVKSTKKKKSAKNDSDPKIELDISNSEMFPEIGAKKPSSKEKRRIKPTHVDQKSVSLNFSSECFQQRSPLALEDNAVFKQQKLQPKESSSNFETERNILKQERHKLMEKFNILNTSASPKTTVTPQIKITQKESEKSQNYAKVDVKRVMMKEKIDFLVEIYDTFFKNNLILSVNTEIYYLISLLLSKQCEEDCLAAENMLIENNYEFLLKSINNITYFAVKSLWNLRSVLEVILDKNSLKTLGENKKVRSFYPDLAKFLLNCYGLRCEAEANQEKPRTPQDTQNSNGVICFNLETDNADNFPSMLSFQNFKKQRDMFYEIVRWYGASRNSGSSGSWVRSRVKAVVSSSGAANQQHLAALFTSHMLAQCVATAQESKLSKLQRRLTCPTAPESHRLPHFTEKEMFYKEFILNAENESFRVHLRDALSAQILALDSTHLAVENSNTDITKEYIQLCKKLSVLSKFLGYMTSLPYSQSTESKSREIKEPTFHVPKEKVLENDLALRSYSQPNLDLKGYLKKAQENGRLSITIPWIVHYLSMLDYASLRIKYFKELLKILFDIYINTLKFSHNLKKNTVIYLKSVLGWLFDLPQFPQELFYEKQGENVVILTGVIDTWDLIDESAIFELCPYLREVNVLLATCRVSQAKVCSYRHITPVSLSLNPEDRIKSKEKELQTRLEEELLKSQPSSTRRVLELVIERVTAAAVKEFSSTILLETREKARREAREFLSGKSGEDIAALVPPVRAIYSRALSDGANEARSIAGTCVRTRTGAALAALVPLATPLHALAARAARDRLLAFLHHHWNDTAILCKDIESEVKSLLSMGDVSPTHKQVDVAAMIAPSEQFEAVNVSPAACIINLKEAACIILEGGTVDSLPTLLSNCALSCSPNNVFCRPPTQRAVMQLSLDLAILFVSRKPKELDSAMLSSLHAIWNVCCPDRKPPPPQPITLERREGLSPVLRNFEDEERAQTPISDEETGTDGATVTANSERVQFEVRPITSSLDRVQHDARTVTSNPDRVQLDSKTITSNPDKRVEVRTTTSNPEKKVEPEERNCEFFERVLCPRNIVLLSATQCRDGDVWEAMASLLVYLLNNNYLSEDSLTEQCLAVYRQDWPQTILENLSTCMKSVSSRWSRSATGKFTLFLDFLAEYCGDMDFEPMD